MGRDKIVSQLRQGNCRHLGTLHFLRQKGDRRGWCRQRVSDHSHFTFS